MVSVAYISVNVRCLGTIQDSIYGVRCAPFSEKIHEITLWCLINELRIAKDELSWALRTRCEDWKLTEKFPENLKYGWEKMKKKSRKVSIALDTRYCLKLLRWEWCSNQVATKQLPTPLVEAFVWIRNAFHCLLHYSCKTKGENG